jgi:hypothetical protein
MRLADSRLDLDSVAEELVGPEVRLIEVDAGRVGCVLELLDGGADLGGCSLGWSGYRAQEVDLDAAVVVALVPLAEVAVAKALGGSEEVNDAVLRLALRSGCLGHGCLG